MNVKDFNFKKARKELGGILFPGPSMLSKEEAVFYFFIGKHIFTSSGNIVDAGCWLGSSTYYLAKGLEESGSYSASNKIISCDLFKWDDLYNNLIEPNTLEVAAGNNFMHLTESYLDKVKIPHKIYAIDYSISPKEFKYYTYKDPIEILLVDAGKTPDLLFNILEGYLPHAVENKTLVFFQDYRDYFCWFTPVVVQMLSEVLEPRLYLDTGGACFVVKNTQNIKQVIEAARYNFMNDAKSVEAHYDSELNAVKKLNLNAYYQLLANRVGMILHFNKVTEVYFGPSELKVEKIENGEVKKDLYDFINRMDNEWPVMIKDWSLQNAFRRVSHACTGHKDLVISFETFNYFKRRLFNPKYLKVKLVRGMKKIRKQYV